MNDMIDQNIAIIGMACRFPGANNYQEFWNNLVAGVNSIQEMPPERWNIDKYYSPIIDEPNKSISKWCGLLDNIDQFDNRFFYISPREAKNMDPQQRLLLEETWHCIEDSGVSLKSLQDKKTSVYVGVMALDYYQEACASNVVIDSYAALGNYECILANRLSHTFGFQGESISIDAACASSLVALHHAKVTLQSGESDYAIAAGVSLDIQPWKYISFSKSRMLSPDGQCKTFDKDANGYVPGEGVGVLLLQPLDEARRARNHIYGVIKGSAVNHGGHALSMTAPRVEAQRDVILAAYQNAKITPETTTYVEAHGTGTSLGDPIEVEALTLAFREYTDDHQFCSIGAVKTNIGHLEAAAGIAGVIKVLMMMQHQKIPPILNFKTINPVINFDHSPFVLATSLGDWHSRNVDLPLRAGVSSFGFGGVNAHALLEYYPPQSQREEASGDFSHLFVISAKSSNALKNTLSGWQNFVDSDAYSKYSLTDICATLKTVRHHFSYRYGGYVKNKDELKAFLQKDLPSLPKPVTHDWCLHVSRWNNFADVQPLLEQEPLIKKHLNTVQQCLSTIEFSHQGSEKQTLDSFMMGYAYLSALIELGFTPSLIISEKGGLWLALSLSGMMTLDDTLAVLSHQKTLEEIKLARPHFPFYDLVTLQTHMPFHFDENYLHFLVDGLNIATADMDYFVEKTLLLKDNQFTFKKYLEEWDLILRHHSGKSLDSMLYVNDKNQDRTTTEKVLLLLIIKTCLRQLDKKWELSHPKRITDHKFHELLDLVIDGVIPKEALIKLFFGEQSTEFADLATLMNKRQEHLNLKKPYEFLKKHRQNNPVIDNVAEWFKTAMEIESHCPFPHLSSLMFGKSSSEQRVAKHSKQVFITEAQSHVFQETLLQLWLHGVDIKWNILFPEGSFNKVSLPTYGFDRLSFWLSKKDEPGFVKRMQLTEQKWSELLDQVLEGTIPKETMIKILSSDNPELAAKIATVESHNSRQDSNNISKLQPKQPMYYMPVWQEESLSLSHLEKSPETVLIFSDTQGVGDALSQKFQNAVIVLAAKQYAQIHQNTYEINVSEGQDYRHILEQSPSAKKIYFLWEITSHPTITTVEAFEAYENKTVMPLFRLCKILSERKVSLELIVVTSHLHQVIADETRLFPYTSPMLGLAKVLGLENPSISIRCVDIDLDDIALNIALLVEEKGQVPLFKEIAYRGGKRYIKTIVAQSSLPTNNNQPVTFKQKGVYLIVGGMGGIGLALSRFLAENFQARLILTGRSRLNKTKQQQIQTLQQFGGEVLYLTADVANFDDMSRVVQTAKQKFGPIQGVIHSALVMASSLIKDMSEDIFKQALEPKSKGSFILNQVTSKEAVDFVLFFSSFITFKGDVGVGNYTAGCAFQDAYVYYLRTIYQRPAMVINWGHWGEIGIAANPRFKQIIKNLDVETLHTNEGIQGFQEVIKTGKPQVMVAKLGDEWFTPTKSASTIINPMSNGIKNEHEPEKKQYPRQDHRQIINQVAALVAKTLDIPINDIGLDDRFSEFGMDSILGVELVNAINKALNEPVLNTSAIFDYPSINELSEYIRQQMADVESVDEELFETQPAIQFEPDKEKSQENRQLYQEDTHDNQIYPLSHGQKALWFLYQLAPESVAYNIGITLRIRSTLDVPALQNTFQALINHHPCLRTTFTTSDSEPLQKVHQYWTIHFEQIDASTWSGDELNKQVAEAHQRPFDLEQGPVLRVNLFTRATQDHILLLSIHHIAFDGWSLWMLIKELGELYPTLKAGGQADLPSIKYTYADFVHWQMDMLASNKGEHLLAYWQQQLAGELPVLNLPTDHPRPPVQTYQGASVHLFLTEALTQQLKELASTEGTSLYMILLAAYQILLYRYTGQEHILVGSPTTGRTQREFADIMGYFLNMVVLRAVLKGSLTFKDFMEQVRQTVLKALDHQDYPFPLLVEHLQPNRDPSYSPLFQVVFVYQKPQQFGESLVELFAPGERVNLGGLELENFELGQQEGTFDLNLEMMEAKNALVGTFKYNTDLFEEATIIRMVGHFQTLLEGIVANPLHPIHALPLLTEAEQQQLLAWNDTTTDYPRDKTIVNLFEEQVKKTPDAIAVVFENQQLSYSELNSQANQLAHYLQTLGVKPEVKVGICVERSIEMVIGLLGIFKAGGAYLPLDPAYPAARLAFMLEDAQVPVLLTQSSLKAGLPETIAQVVCLDSEVEILSRFQVENLSSGVEPENLAYVIYTSGSTGKPKGVQIYHRSLVNFIKSMESELGLKASDGLLAVTTIGFDIHTLEIYLPLMVGATVIIASREAAIDSSQLVAQLAHDGVTTMQATPATWQMLLTANWQGSPNLKAICGGEALSRKLARNLLDKVGDLWNLYGPTETTVWSTTCKVQLNSASGSEEAPESIGRPIANTQVYVLDKHLQQVPIGVPGELHLGGAGLARGYLNRPELTAEKFIEVEILDKNERIYKTGDLARYLPDGNIEYLGRIDNQVKIRGFRIELGEIETLLSQNSTVRENVVIVREDQPDDKRIVGYIVPHKKAAPTSHQLRQFLKDKLPDYMIPSAFVTLEALPLTPNGKVDRRALLAPENTHLPIEDDSIKPQTEIEQSIAAVWQEVLHIENVGIHNNFFDLGGHSLLLGQVQSKLQDLLDQKISMVELFEYPTIHALAQHFKPEQYKPALTQPKPAESRQTRTDSPEIAIIGMAGRFPMAPDIDTFWQNLQEGIEAITFFSDEELQSAGVDTTTLNKPNYVKANGVLADIELFDAAFFDFNPREAEITDPQHRLFLECAWESLESAGYAVQTDDSIGVYAGVGMNTYLPNNLTPNREFSESVGSYSLMIGNDKDFMPTRVSYKLNLKGPSINVQTACSTSLVAIHLACKSLLDGECNIALAGGVSVRIPQTRGYLFQEGMILSPDGHCRAFDAEAKGTVGGDGVGIVVLKRLDKAIADGDHIHAIIKGSALNNDGALKIGYTAPSVDGQAAVIAEAQAAAGIDAETISYIEAHGTGTTLGDPIEIAALTKAFRATTDKNGFCAIGSVKTNIGHTDAAAGVANLIKTVLALKHQLLPPSLHFAQPNPQIDFANSPFYVNSTLAEWKTNGTPRRAGVSSFGIGGTNAHVILEEAPTQVPSEPSRPWQLLVLSAKTPSALATATSNLATYLEQHPDINLADVAYTLSQSRQAFNHRRMLLCQNLDEATTALRTIESANVVTLAQEQRTVVFMFSGQGAQYVNMGLELYQQEPSFRQQVDFCSEYLKPQLGLDLRQVLYPNEEQISEAAQQLKQTAITQAALFVTEYALAKLWMTWGINPQAMIGHSIGEYVAACLSGVFSIEEALSLVAIRGQLMQEMPRGTMLAIPLSESEVQPLLNNELSLALINGPSRCVVSGPTKSIERLQNQLIEQGVECRPLHTSHAFHSEMMEPILVPFTKRVKQMKLNPPKIPYVSNVTGTWITAAQATNPSYWAKHIRQTVRFSEGLQQILAKSEPILLEVGPAQTLTALAKQHPAKIKGQVVLSSLRHPQEKQSDIAFILNTVGKLWLAGGEIDWSEFYAHEQRQRMPLPTYPFERQRYWVDPPNMTSSTQSEPSSRLSQKIDSSPHHSRPTLEKTYVAPRNELEQKITDIWQQTLGIEPLGIYDNFFELGGDSLIAVQLLTKLRETLQMELSTHALLNAPTIAALAETMGELEPSSIQQTLPSLLVELKTGNNQKPPLFLVHPAGGSVYFYRHLSDNLESEQPVYGIQGQGLDGKTKLLTQVEELATLYIETLRVRQPQGPYFLGGASFGGTVAFEMAQQLHAQSQQVALLTMIDTPGQDYMPAELKTDAEIIAYLLKVDMNVSVSLDELRKLEPDEQLHYLVEEQKKMNRSMFPDLDITAVRHFFHLFKRDIQVMLDYHPQVYPGRIIYFRATETTAYNPQTPERAWLDLAQEGLEVIDVPGNHITMNEAPHVQVIAERLKTELEKT